MCVCVVVAVAVARKMSNWLDDDSGGCDDDDDEVTLLVYNRAEFFLPNWPSADAPTCIQKQSAFRNERRERDKGKNETK